MLPATKTIPKEMLPLVDKPVLQYIIEEAVSSGIEDILIVTNRSKTAMDDYFDYYPELEHRLIRSGKDEMAHELRAVADMANFFYVRQRETKGLGHAIARARRFIGDEPFAVLLGDDIMMSEKPVLKQLIEAAEKYNCSCVGGQWVSDEMLPAYCTTDLAHVEGRVYDVRHIVEKPKPEEVMSNYAILGRYVLTPDIFDILDALPPGRNGEIQLTDGLAELCHQKRMVYVDFDGRRYDTGHLTGFLEATLDFALKHEETGDWLRNYIKEKAKTL